MFRFDPCRLALTAMLLGTLATTACTTTAPLTRPADLVFARAGIPSGAKAGDIDKLILAPEMVAKLREEQLLRKIVDGFLASCGGKAVGCAISAVGPLGVVAEGGAGAARRNPPDPAARNLQASDKITMASVSKTFTAAALQKLLFDRGICVDTPIGAYLPKHWQRAQEVDAVTFRQLLTHTSGLHCPGIGYSDLKSCLATARPCPSSFWYANENFALMRILIPEIEGIPPSTLKPLVASDLQGDWGPISKQYADRYIAYVNQAVFAKAGLPTLFCKVTDPEPALSYKSKNDPKDKWNFTTLSAPGEDWGDMTEACGSQGWFLSAHQMAQALHAIMTPDTVLPGGILEQMKTGQLGLYFGDHGGSLQSWSHGGYHPSEWNRGEINTVLVYFNYGVSIGVIVNSPYGANGEGGDLFGDLLAAVQAAN